MSTLVPPIANLSQTESCHPPFHPSFYQQAIPALIPLPLHRLALYKPVTDQFQDYGLLMQNAVALVPFLLKPFQSLQHRTKASKI